MSHGGTLSSAVVEPTEPPTEEHQSQEPTNHDGVDGASNQHDWWDDADVSVDPEAFCHFLYGYNQLLENSDSDGDGDETIPRASNINIESSPDRQTKLKESPSMKE
jgi:hypothetical protein